MSPLASHEFSRVGLLATLPGEKLARLGDGMRREPVAAGGAVPDPDDRFYVLLSGVMSSREADGRRKLLHPGDIFAGFELAADVPRAGALRALTPSVVASCDRPTFEELVRPLFDARERPASAS